MDNRIRRHEICIINLPRCDFAFSSTRSCFIAYGFADSHLEMTILRNLLRDRNIEAFEAGGHLAPGQYAFCTKICSKIITSQFCIVLLNNHVEKGAEIPNANVNMEYGLMLGFNKYVIPFQRASQQLPFNVSGLDTIKYNDASFEHLTAKAIDKAIEDTKQEQSAAPNIDRVLSTYLLSRNMVVNTLSNDADKPLFELGNVCGFNLINDFSGLKYVYFGNFAYLTVDAILWRLRKLETLLLERSNALPTRVALTVADDQQRTLLLAAANAIFDSMEIWVLVASDEDRKLIGGSDNIGTFRPLEVITVQEIWQKIESEFPPT
jgi:hypothetical protein